MKLPELTDFENGVLTHIVEELRWNMYPYRALNVSVAAEYKNLWGGVIQLTVRVSDLPEASRVWVISRQDLEALVFPEQYARALGEKVSKEFQEMQEKIK